MSVYAHLQRLWRRLSVHPTKRLSRARPFGITAPHSARLAPPTFCALLALLAGRTVEQGRAFTTPNDPDGHVHVSTVAQGPFSCGVYVRGGTSSGQSTNPTGYNYIEPSRLGRDCGRLARPLLGSQHRVGSAERRLGLGDRKKLGSLYSRRSIMGRYRRKRSSSRPSARTILPFLRASGRQVTSTRSTTRAGTRAGSPTIG